MRRAAFLSLLLLAGCAQAEAGTPWGRRQDAAKAAAAPPQRLRVIDGDTFVLDGETIRIENIDAPERGKRARCLAEAALADRASEALEVIVRRPVSLERSGRDRYGRTLARVFVTTPSGNSSDVGEVMVTAGWAARWDGHRREWCAEASLHERGVPLTSHPATVESTGADLAPR